jgi:hypothetical protein
MLNKATIAKTRYAMICLDHGHHGSSSALFSRLAWLYERPNWGITIPYHPIPSPDHWFLRVHLGRKAFVNLLLAIFQVINQLSHMAFLKKTQSIREFDDED